MTKMDKLELLDTCTDGNIEKFHKLVQDSYEHLNILFKLCKDNIAPEYIEDVKFESIDSTQSTFNVICVSKKSDINLFIPENLSPNSVKVNSVTGGFIVNISTNN